MILGLKFEKIPNPGPRVQNHWVAPGSTQPFIYPRSIKYQEFLGT